jgi:hypothetical protein
LKEDGRRGIDDGDKKEQPNDQPDTPHKEHRKEEKQSKRVHTVRGILCYQLSFGTKD